MIRAVFFDMDGVLIDTEKYLTVYRQQAMREAGYRMRLEEAYSFRSLASKFAGEKAKKLYGADFDYGKIRMRRKELMAEHIEKYGLEKKPYVAETIGELRRRGYQTAVVTATAEDRTLRYLDMLGFTDLFDVVVCASMVENGKPCPDVYSLCVRESGKKAGRMYGSGRFPEWCEVSVVCRMPCDNGAGSHRADRRNCDNDGACGSGSSGAVGDFGVKGTVPNRKGTVPNQKGTVPFRLGTVPFRILMEGWLTENGLHVVNFFFGCFCGRDVVAFLACYLI